MTIKCVIVVIFLILCIYTMENMRGKLVCLYIEAGNKVVLKAIYDSYGQDYGTMNELIDYMNSLPDYAFMCVDTTKSGKEKYKKMRALAKIAKFYHTLYEAWADAINIIDTPGLVELQFTLVYKVTEWLYHSLHH